MILGKCKIIVQDRTIIERAIEAHDILRLNKKEMPDVIKAIPVIQAQTFLKGIQEGIIDDIKSA